MDTHRSLETVTISDLAFTPPGLRAPLFQGLTLSLNPGELVFLRGANGTGKSSCLKVLARQLEIYWQEKKLPLDHFYLPQLTNLHIHMRVTLMDVIKAMVGQELVANLDSIKQEVSRMGLLQEQQLYLPWDVASGGERQRALLTASLIRDVSIQLWDEPSNHLDALATLRLRDEVLYRLKDRRQVFVMVCHEDMELLALKDMPGIRTKTLLFDGSECRIQEDRSWTS